MKVILYKTNKAFDKIMDSEARQSLNPVLLFVSCQTLAEFFSLSGPQFIYDLAILKTQQVKGFHSAWHVVHALKT